MQLAEDERIVGECLFARHAIGYDALPSYFLGFAWIVGDEFQSWDNTLGRFLELGIATVPMLYRGPYRDHLFEDLAAAMNFEKQEGFVARVAGAFRESDMQTRTGKFVRPTHVQSAVHWTKQELVRNGLA